MTREYKNGNLHIALENDRLKELKENNDSCFMEVMFSLNDIDCYSVGDTFCACYEECFYLYNYRRDLMYLVAMSDFDRIQKGKTVILKAWTPDSGDREFLADNEEY